MPRSGAAPTRDHEVLFFDHAECVAERIATFVSAGLRDGDTVVAVLTPERAAELETSLTTGGLAPDRVRADGRLVVHEAAQTLATFMRDGSPDAALLRRELGDPFLALQAAGRPVRAVGEMVSLLWSAGNVGGALALEQIWNQLAADLRLPVLCPYPASLLKDAGLPEVGRLCALHTHLVAPESYGLPAPAPEVPASWAREVFVPTTGAVAAARRLVAGVVAEWATAGVGVDPFVVSDACLVVSELASNAVVHGRSAFEVTVTCRPGGVRIAVADNAVGAAVAHHGEALEVHGRGLAIVEDVADRWGWHPRRDGKVVWAELDARRAG